MKGGNAYVITLCTRAFRQWETTVLLQEMMHQLKDDPNGPLMVYIVPDQMTFSTEYKLVSNPQLQGMMRLQVYSFPRLAWRVLQETGRNKPSPY